MKRALFSLFVLVIFIMVWYFCVNVEVALTPLAGSYTDITQDYEWAHEAIQYFSANGVLSGTGNDMFSPDGTVTREQFAKLLVTAFDIPLADGGIQVYTDVPLDRWSFKYIETARLYMGIGDMRFEPERNVTREEIAQAIVKVKGIGSYGDSNIDILMNYQDYSEVDPGKAESLAIAARKGYIKGANGRIEPKASIKRAEIAVVLYRAVLDKVEAVLDVEIIGAAEVAAEDAKAWAVARGADERFINIADVYWEYGELTGIRADVLYAQAAKETNYGKYTGKVKPEMNNWAGIKVPDATGDTTEDHETFDTPEDGVRAHFNHISAYVGVPPIGETHGRYAKVITAEWAGTVRNVFELSGKWAPAEDYGESIVKDYLNIMKNFRVNG